MVFHKTDKYNKNRGGGQKTFALPSIFTIQSPPVPYGTAPVGHWGAFSPNPLRRYALRALFHSPPVPHGTAPVWHWGAFSPNPLRRYAPMSEKNMREKCQVQEDSTTIYPDRARSVGSGTFLYLTRLERDSAAGALRKAQQLKIQRDSSGDPKSFLGVERIPLDSLTKQVSGLKP